MATTAQGDAEHPIPDRRAPMVEHGDQQIAGRDAVIGVPPAAAAPATSRSDDDAAAATGRDVAELLRLVRVLERHAAPSRAAGRRALLLIGEEVPVGAAEQHLRAVTALLVSLTTYRRAVTRRRSGGGPHRPPRAAPAEADETAGAAAAAPRLPPTVAAASAIYIARDLAARRLTEFTSAEGYRLARSLAAAGGVGEQVERLLADANRVRLHPMPLAEPLSHSHR